MDRRTTMKWVLAASAAWPLATRRPGRAGSVSGYGTDPKLLRAYHPGQVWPLTLTAAQRRLAGVLVDLIIPADDHSPSASAVGVVDFIDEWLSAPYPDNQHDQDTVLRGFRWLDAESMRRAGKVFADLDAGRQRGICDDICDATRAAEKHRTAARFFARFRDLTAGGFYSSPSGRSDLNYTGNVPLTRFDGPPPELLKRLNLP
ncbi:MAG TPA: gluconate 2-dehydrogenase subunit 3 family protein [Steroidobacteraceae bacterium]|jgi:hypothetical protein|nr:gluconate 2-dehydrogenase subunit 3 family protein [Steroidobacteraceae bacterium]